MKTYLKSGLSVDEVVLELEANNNNIQIIEKDSFYMIHYNPANEIDHEAVRINKDDSRVVFSATSTLFRDQLKEKIITF